MVHNLKPGFERISIHRRHRRKALKLLLRLEELENRQNIVRLNVQRQFAVGYRTARNRGRIHRGERRGQFIFLKLFRQHG